MSEPVVVVRNLVKSFQPDFWVKPVRVLSGISFELAHKKVTGFVGFNGSGKTTTLKCILGFIQPDEGEVKLFGDELEAARSRIGYLPERPYYYDFLTGRQYLRYHWDLSALPEDTEARFQHRSAELLRLVGLEANGDKRLRSYSKGMLQRIGIAQALLRDPELLLLDEPMSGLDPDGREMVRDLILALKSQGKTIFFSSHLLGDMIALCDDIVAVHQGRILYKGTLPDLLKEEEAILRAETQVSQRLEKKFQRMIAESGAQP